MSTGERRAELDGVRGVAILLVLVGHGLSQWRLGSGAGPAGVTVFFVLSGYLITGILTSERRRGGRVNLRRFYARRMTRLAPPLLVMLVVSAAVLDTDAAAWWSAASWTSNYAGLAAVDLGPYGHTWSLAVEEQFYLLWPPLLLLLLAYRRPVVALGGIVGLLFAWRLLLLVAGEYHYAYSALETAGSGILVGCLVALARWRLRAVWAVVACVWIALVAVGCVMAGDPAWAFAQLLVTPAAAVLVAAAGSCRWLAWRPLTAAGVASYSLYLWHMPVSVMVDGRLTLLGVLAGAGAGVLAFGVVEAPLMRWRSRGSVVATEPAEAVLLRGEGPHAAHAGVVAAEVLPQGC